MPAVRHPARARRATLAAGLGVIVVCAVALAQWRALAVQVHLFCFARDSMHFLAAAASAEGSVARSAVTACIETRWGKELLRRCFVEEVLAQCRMPDSASSVLPPLEEDRELTIS